MFPARVAQEERRSIVLANAPVEYVLREHSHSRRLSVRIALDGSVSVCAPPRTLPRSVESFLKKHEAWIVGTQARMRRQFFGSVRLGGGRRSYALYKEAARALARERIDYFNRHPRLRVERMSIRNQKTRWGSASKDGSLSFNYRIALLPPSLCDYVIIHELCHLREHNHSPRFWRLVEEMLPEYRQCRSALRAYRM